MKLAPIVACLLYCLAFSLLCLYVGIYFMAASFSGHPKTLAAVCYEYNFALLIPVMLMSLRYRTFAIVGLWSYVVVRIVSDLFYFHELNSFAGSTIDKFFIIAVLLAQGAYLATLIKIKPA